MLGGSGGCVISCGGGGGGGGIRRQVYFKGNYVRVILLWESIRQVNVIVLI